MRFSAFSQSSFLSFLTGLLLLSSCSVQNHQFLAGFEVATVTQQPAEPVSKEFEPIESTFHQAAPPSIKSTKSVSSEGHESLGKAELPLELKAIPTIKNRSPKTPNDVASNAVAVEQLKISTPKNTNGTHQSEITDTEPDVDELRKKAKRKSYVRIVGCLLAILWGVVMHLGLGVIFGLMLMVSALKWSAISKSDARLTEWWMQNEERKNLKFIQKLPHFLKWLIAIPLALVMFVAFLFRDF